MKIVHICLTGGYTEGINYQENYLTKYQALDGNDVSIITTQYCWKKNVWKKCKESNYTNPYGVYVVRLPYKWAIPYRLNTYIGEFVGLYDELCELEPDIIFIHNLQFWDLKKIDKYKKKHLDIKVYADSHTDFSNSARSWVSRNILYGLYWKRCAKIIEKDVIKFYGVLPVRVDFLKNVYGLPQKKLDLLVMGADDESVERVSKNKVRKRFREEYHIDDNDFLIITGGKIDAFKTQTLLLMKAIKSIKDETVKLCIFGSIEKKIRLQFDKLCDGNKIQYIGWANGDQSYDFFSAADLVVFPGRHSVYWEQVAGMGIPMVCKRWPGIDHIDYGGNVQFLDKDSVEEIKDILIKLLGFSETYQKMLLAAQKEERKQFSYKEISRKAVGCERHF